MLDLGHGERAKCCDLFESTYAHSAFLCLSAGRGSWSSQALLLEAKVCCFPATPNEVGREEAGSRREGGRELLPLESS